MPTIGAAASAGGATYHQFNTMRCSHYQHNDVQDPTAGTYYYDCVGFTSYTLRTADRPAWNALVSTVHLLARANGTPHWACCPLRHMSAVPIPMPDRGSGSAPSPLTPARPVR